MVKDIFIKDSNIMGKKGEEYKHTKRNLRIVIAKVADIVRQFKHGSVGRK